MITPVTFSLDDATLSGGATIVAAGGGLPRRILAPSSALVLGATALYSMNETSGLVMVDSGPNLVHGVIEPGTVLVASGRYGGAYQAGAVPARLAYVGRSAWLEPAFNEPFSVSAWLYIINANQKSVANNLAGSPTYAGWELTYDAGRIYFHLIQNAGTSAVVSAYAALTPAFGSWVHFVGTYSGSGVSSGVNVYYNGVLQTPTRAGNGISGISYSQPVHVGERVGGVYRFSAGERIDAISVFKGKCLTPTEVLQLYTDALGVGSARFALPAHASAKSIIVPGATALTLSHGGARTVRGYLSLDGGATRAEAEINAYDADGLPVGGAGTGLTLDLDIISGSAWIADANGGGPVVLVEEPDPTANVTAVHSSAGIIELTFDLSVGTVPTPSSDPYPATNVIGATANANTLTLTTVAPEPSVTSVISTSGHIDVILDMPIVSTTHPGSDPYPATNVTDATILGSTLTLTTVAPVPHVDSIESSSGKIDITLSLPISTTVQPVSDPQPATQLTTATVNTNLLSIGADPSYLWRPPILPTDDGAEYETPPETPIGGGERTDNLPPDPPIGEGERIS